jgi:hypothetical protein
VTVENKTRNECYTMHALKDVISFDGGDSLQSQAQS